MDIQKEEDDFNDWFNKQTINAVPDADLSLQRLWASLAWQAQAAKSQAVPEGFVLVPVTPSDEFIDKLAGVICDEFDTTISGSAHCATEAYKLMIESQDKANDP